jgi:hypothetical protein
MSEEATRQTAKALGWTLLKGGMSPCDDCAVGKGRQKNLPKDKGGPVASLSESRAYLDCATITDKSHAVKYVWQLIVLYPSQLKITDIYKTKRGMVEPTVEMLHQLL